MQRLDKGTWFHSVHSGSELALVDGFPVKEANLNVFDIYMREAKVYDTAMVERWKTAMEGLLIFVSHSVLLLGTHDFKGRSFFGSCYSVYHRELQDPATRYIKCSRRFVIPNNATKGVTSGNTTTIGTTKPPKPKKAKY